ncbi:hypothetical protein Ancab_038331 [Ancistrocladus abbreviatus]
MKGNTWFMSSLADTFEKNEVEYLYFPSKTSKGHLLCMMGNDPNEGTKNSYALAWREGLPNSAILLKGLSFISSTYYDYQNLWHGVELLTFTDTLALPHGAQMTNMIFMDRNNTVMEFFPKGWLELAGMGQYALHWLAEHSGMKHPRAWWEKLNKKECPHPGNKAECWHYYKYGLVGHNATYFAEWARAVLKQVKLSKQKSNNLNNLDTCSC